MDDKESMVRQYRQAVRELRSGTEQNQRQAKRTMARLERIAIELYGEDFANELHQLIDAPETAEHQAAVKRIRTGGEPKSQVFGFKASPGDVTRWKTYAAASGETVADFGKAACDEYITNHPLTEETKQAYAAEQQSAINKL